MLATHRITDISATIKLGQGAVFNFAVVVYQVSRHMMLLIEQRLSNRQ
jgi:hypothetical protein